MKKLKCRKKRLLTLLEVLIAMLIITLALPILVSSFVFTYSQQSRFLDEVALDTIANSAFVSLFEDLSKGQISYKNLEVEQEFPVSVPGNWEGTYAFKKLQPDKPPKEGTTYFVELWEVTFNFTHPRQKKTHTFKYNLIAVRDLTPTEAPKTGEAPK